MNEVNNVPGFRIDDNIRIVQSEKLQSLRSIRDNNHCTICLRKISEAALEGTNLMPLVIDAVENYCTLGEISDTLRKVFGEYK